MASKKQLLKKAGLSNLYIDMLSKFISEKNFCQLKN